jgi:hypothetical protein
VVVISNGGISRDEFFEHTVHQCQDMLYLASVNTMDGKAKRGEGISAEYSTVLALSVGLVDLLGWD